MSTIECADRLKGITESVRSELNELALQHKPLNLGQGFPDFAAPHHVRQALADSAISDNVLLDQYTRGSGHPRLVSSLSKLYSKLINRDIDENREILVTFGAYEALFCCFMAFINAGDEVIIIEPFFDCYQPMTVMAEGIPVLIPMRPKLVTENSTHTSKDWILDREELESKFSAKTKMIVVNTPHNPTGKIFSREELELIADLCKKYNCVAVMDEVYEWIVYKDCEHIRMATLPDMWERTITIGSAGKTFSVTGWKLGWAYGPRHLIKPLQRMHQNCVHTCATPIQEAVAIGFETEINRLNSPDSYWTQLAAMLEPKRDRMAAYFSSVSMTPTLPDGGYFMVADVSRVAHKLDLSAESGTKDCKFAKWLSKNRKLHVIPGSAFYSEPHKHLIRICFIKNDETLQKAEDIINELKETLKNK